MAVVFETFSLRTRREGEVVNIAANIQEVLERAGLADGVAFLFVPGSTAALTMIEYEPGLIQDLPNTLDRLVPKEIPYEHEKRWHDGNGHSHVRDSLLGPDLHVPIPA